MDSGSFTSGAIRLVTDSDESPLFTTTNSIPESSYKTIVILINDLKERFPSCVLGFVSTPLIHDDDFSVPQDYNKQTCIAVTTYESICMDCFETFSSTFTSFEDYKTDSLEMVLPFWFHSNP